MIRYALLLIAVPAPLLAHGPHPQVEPGWHAAAHLGIGAAAALAAVAGVLALREVRRRGRDRCER